jgi:hypothetical protein
MQSFCSNCGKGYRHQLADPWLIICAHCQHVMKGDGLVNTNQLAMPDDWSTIQIGSTGNYKDQNFLITGRVRIQMRNDFRNLWCAQYGKETLWIGQSLEGVGFFQPPFAEYPKEFQKKIRAGIYVEFSEAIKLKCEIIDKCLGVHFEGELSQFPYPDGKFTILQANNSNGNTVLVFMRGEDSAQFLWGVTALVYGVTFENTKRWSEWEIK